LKLGSSDLDVVIIEIWRDLDLIGPRNGIDLDLVITLFFKASIFC